MAESKVQFSVLTPTWNRASLLLRVFDGLLAQTYRNFEWIVADDGSADETEQVVRSLAEQADFMVTYVRADQHVGKIRMDNEAIGRARGALILWCDSDDWFLPKTLQCLSDAWLALSRQQRHEYAGLTALAASEQGCIVNPFVDDTPMDVGWNALSEQYDMNCDMLFCTRADLLKTHPFPEVDLVIPESVVWSAIGHQPTVCIPEVLLMKEYRTPNAISFSGEMAYNRGRAYALAISVRNLRAYPREWKVRFWRIMSFIRYGLHGEIPVSRMRSLWGDNSSSLAYWICFFPAYFLSVKDLLQGKVRKTHREFLAVQKKAKITVEIFNQV